jgi:hypothetical protein
MNLKKGTIYNTPLNPLSRGEFLGEFSQEGSFWGEFSQEGSYTKFLLICNKYIESFDLIIK